MLTTTDYLAVLRREGDAFADSIAQALNAPVASCGPWVGADLLRHMIEVHYSWKFIAHTHLMNPDDYAPRSKPADNALLSEYRTGLSDLIGVLSLLDPARSVRTVWVQFTASDGSVTQYSDSIDVITEEPAPTPTPTTTAPSTSTTTSTTPTTKSVPEVSVARTLAALQPVVVAKSYAPVRSATVVPRQNQSNIEKIQTKIGKQISTRTVIATKSGKYVIVFPKGTKSMSVRFVSKSGLISAWSRIAAPK